MTDRVLTEGGYSNVIRQGIREVETVATTIVGSVKELSSGREVRYVKVGTVALARGRLVQGVPLVANHQNVTITVTASIGEKELTFTDGGTSAAQDIYKGAFALITSGAGSHMSYMIQGHNAWSASSTSAKVLLKDGLEFAVAVTNEMNIIPNPDNGVVVCPVGGTPSATLRGVTLMSAAIGSYCYVGKKGPWSVLKSSLAITQGGAVMPGSGAGTVRAGTTNVIGHALTTSDASSITTYVLIDFDL